MRGNKFVYRSLETNRSHVIIAFKIRRNGKGQSTFHKFIRPPSETGGIEVDLSEEQMIETLRQLKYGQPCDPGNIPA